MKLSKKIILSLGATAIVAAPLQTIIALGEKNTATPEDTKAVNNVTKDQILQVVKSAIGTNTDPVTAARSLNGKILTVGDNVKLIISCIGDNSAGTLTYKIVSLVKGTAVRDQAELAGLGGQVTGLFTANQQYVNAITQKDIIEAINSFVDKNKSASVAAADMNKNHSVVSISTHKVQVAIHLTSNDSKATLIYSVESVTLTDAKRAAADLPGLGGQITGFLNKDQAAVDAITQAQIFKVVTKGFVVKGLASAVAKVINSTASTYTVGPDNVQVIIHAIADDTKGTLAYTVEGIQLNAARGNPDTFPKLGATITGFHISDQGKVNAITAKMLNDFLSSKVIRDVMASNPANTSISNSMMGDRIIIHLEVTPDDTKGTLTYKVLSITKLNVKRADADLPGLGGVLTGFLTQNQDTVNNVTVAQIQSTIESLVNKSKTPCDAAADLNYKHSFITMPGSNAIVNIHATGDYDTYSLTWEVLSVKKGIASRKDVSMLHGVVTDFNPPSNQVVVDNLSVQNIKNYVNTQIKARSLNYHELIYFLNNDLTVIPRYNVNIKVAGYWLRKDGDNIDIGFVVRKVWKGSAVRQNPGKLFGEFDNLPT